MSALPPWLRRLPALLGLALLLAAIIAVQSEFRRLSLAEIERSIEDTPATALLSAALCSSSHFGRTRG